MSYDFAAANEIRSRISYRKKQNVHLGSLAGSVAVVIGRYAINPNVHMTPDEVDSLNKFRLHIKSAQEEFSVYKRKKGFSFSDLEKRDNIRNFIILADNPKNAASIENALNDIYDTLDAVQSLVTPDQAKLLALGESLIAYDNVMSRITKRESDKGLDSDSLCD